MTLLPGSDAAAEGSRGDAAAGESPQCWHSDCTGRNLEHYAS